MCMEVYFHDLAEQGGAVASELVSTSSLSAPVAHQPKAAATHDVCIQSCLCVRAGSVVHYAAL